jgi:hypothetical protein
MSRRRDHPELNPEAAAGSKPLSKEAGILEVKIVRRDNGSYDVVSVPAPIFDVETEEPKRNDRGIVIYTKEELLKSGFDDEESALEWADENEHTIAG